MSAGRLTGGAPLAARPGFFGGSSAPAIPTNMTGMPSPNMALQALSAQPMPRQVMQPFQVGGYNPMQAISQMARPTFENFSGRPMQVQNPIFGGNIPMSFGLPVVFQAPANSFSPGRSAFAPIQTYDVATQSPSPAPAPAPVAAQPSSNFVPGVAGIRAEYDAKIADLNKTINNLQNTYVAPQVTASSYMPDTGYW